MDNLEKLIIDLKESLEREIRDLGAKVDVLADRFDSVEGRMERQGALIQTGSRWVNRMNHWSEKIDANLMKKDKLIADLSDRVRKLEEGRK